MKKVMSFALASSMALSLMAAQASAAAPEPDISSMSVEQLAYMDTETASPDMKDAILGARAEVIYGDQAWTVDGAVSITNADGTVETLPEFTDVFPGWDLDEISAFIYESENDSGISVASAARTSSIGYQDVVYVRLPNEVGDTTTFYNFNATGSVVYAWADSLYGGLTYINIGFTNMDTNSSIGWKPGLTQRQEVHTTTRAGVRYGVRVSSSTPGVTGSAYMVVSETLNVDTGFQG